MLNMIKRIIALLSPQQKRQLFILQGLIILMAITEIIAVASIAPFMGVISNMNIIESNEILLELYILSGAQNHTDFISLAGFAVLGILFSSALLSIITVSKSAHFGAQIGSEVGDHLFHYYMHQNWLYHAAHSSAELTKNISVEAHRLTTQVIQNLLILNSKMILAIFMCACIFAFNPYVALSGLSIFIGAYFIIYSLAKSRLTRNGRILSETTGMRFKIMSEGFGGIKDIILLGSQRRLTEQFVDNGKELAKSSGNTLAITLIPRYLVEFIAIASIILLIITLLHLNDGDLYAILPLLSVYGMAGLKLLPALQQSYNSLAQVKNGLTAFELLESDLEKSLNEKAPLNRQQVFPLSKLNIHLDNVSFTYPQKNTPAINQISLTISQNTTVGFVGHSGSGKSTLIDLLCGLILPNSGTLSIGEKTIDATNTQNWQKHIGYVSQSIFLADASIIENIAFGLPKEEIDLEKVMRAAAHANLSDFIEQLPEGYSSYVGERGVQLSGGQRQRIGIARALYNESPVLILDEATSALDNMTEESIMNSINSFAHQKTIIMVAHRLSTIQNCDTIYFMSQGNIIDSGTYSELLEHNQEFKKMATKGL